MKYNFNKEEVEKLLLDQKLRICDAAEILNCTVIALQRFMRKENIKIAKRYSIEEKQAVFDLLDCKLYTHKDIANKLGMTLTEVRSIIKNHNYKKAISNKFSNLVSDDFLNNKPLFWYLVGLITTDGHIQDRTNSISIFQNDHKFLLNLQNLIKHSGKIYQHINNNSKIFKLDILNKKFYNFFIENGFSCDKRYNARFLECPKEYLNYYIRGIFDGDGCLFYRYISGRFEGKIIQITTGSLEVAIGLNKFFQNNGWKSEIVNKISIAGNKYYDIKIDDTESVINFCKFIYSGQLQFKLEKKYYKYIKLIKLIELDKQINEIVDTLEKSKEE